MGLVTHGVHLGIRWPVVGALATVCVAYANFGTLTVSGDSMSPTLHSGQYLLYQKGSFTGRALVRGEIVLLQHPRSSELVVKRIYRTEGELVDSYEAPNMFPGLDHQGNLRVPEGFVYVLGDNPPESEDSRMYGPIPEEQIVGRVLYH